METMNQFNQQTETVKTESWGWAGNQNKEHLINIISLGDNHIQYYEPGIGLTISSSLLQ